MAITGAHALLYSSEPDARREVLRDIPGEPADEGWGIVVTAVLPGEVEVMVYEPRHSLAI